MLRRTVIGLAAVGVVGGVLGAPAGAVTRPATFAVGTRTVTFVDRTRSTPAFDTTPASPTRQLVTHLWYPATGRPGPTDHPNATVNRRGAPFPLIVFAHGDNGHGRNYEPMLRQWAAAGYVVAAPDFPVSSRAGAPGVADIANQPQDLRVVLSDVLQFDRAKRGLGRIIDPNRVGLGGHSLGAATVVALVERSCCGDRRVRAAISFSGLALVASEDYPRPSVPLLLVHGNADTTVPYAGSTDLYARVGPPRTLITLLGRGHQSWPHGGAPGDDAVLRATLDFWAGYLRHDRAALRRLDADASVPGVTTLATDP